MKKIIVPLLLIAVFLSSCAETTGKGNLKIVLESTQTKTLKPDERSTTVVKYNVKGIGPSGKTFSRDSSSRSIVIDGLTMGTWTVNATGFNADSQAVVSGSKTFEFNNNTGSVSIGLNATSGTGTIQVECCWNAEVSNPTLKLILEHNDTQIKDCYTPGDSSKSYKYIKSGLQGGYYTLYADLYEGESRICGTIETIQVVTNKTTSGVITISGPNGTKQDSSSLNIIDESGFQITGHFAVEGYTQLPSKIEANTEQTINIIFDSSVQDSDTLNARWFLDGVEVCSGTSLTKSFSSGDHTIYVVISNGTQYETLYYKFSAKVSAKYGSATLLKAVKVSDQNIILAEDSLIGPLPDDHFLVITPSRSSMQVVSLVNNNLVITENKTYNATDLRFTWLPDVSFMKTSSLMNFCSICSGADITHLIYFDRSSGKLDVALWNDAPLMFSGFCKSPPCFIDNITSVALVPSTDFGGTIYLFDSGKRSEEVLSITTTGTEVKTMGTSVRDSDMKSHLCSDGYGNLLAVSTGANSIKFAKTENGVTTSNWYTLVDNQLGNLRKIDFLNNRFAVFESSSKLLIYEFYPQQKYWVSRSVINTIANDFGSSDDGAFIYVADSTGNLTTYRSGLTDNFGKIYNQELDEPLVNLAVNNNFIIGKDAYGNLYIFEIIQEDSSI